MSGTTHYIDARDVELRVQMGADIFFHIHPNHGPRDMPHLSAGYQNWHQGGDLGIAYRFGILVGAYAFQNGRFYWFDGEGMRR